MSDTSTNVNVNTNVGADIKGVVVPQKIPQKEENEKPAKLPLGSGPLPTKAQQEILDKVFDMMNNPNHYNLTVHTEDGDKKLTFITGLRYVEGTFFTDTTDMTIRISGNNITLHVGGILSDNWTIEGSTVYVANGYITSYSFADWLWKNKKEY